MWLPECIVDSNFVGGDVQRERVKRGAVLAFAIILAGCGELSTDPLLSYPLPPGAVPVTPRPQYAGWWREVEACARQTGPFAAVRWAEVPGANTFPYAGGTYAGYWIRTGNSITIAGNYVGSALLVRHEMLHAVLQRGDHPTEYFTTRCGSIISPP